VPGKRYICILRATIAVLFLASGATARDDGCGAPSYKVHRTSPVRTEESGIVVNITIKKGHLTAQEALRLACQLKNDYAEQEVLVVNIFDDTGAAERFTVLAMHAADQTYRDEDKLILGYYRNLATGKEHFEVKQKNLPPEHPFRWREVSRDELRHWFPKVDPSHMAPIRLVGPQYPEVARQARIQGNVVVQLLVDPTGRVIDVQIAEGHPMLTQVAEQTARQWEFSKTPARAEVVAIRWVFEFRLQGEPVAYRPCPQVLFLLPDTVRVTSRFSHPSHGGSRQ
jgi:TonB family protein